MADNRRQSAEELSDNLSEFYESFLMSGNQWFVCKYSDCQQTERQESEIIEHLRQHFDEFSTEDEAIDDDNPNKVNIDLSEESTDSQKSVQSVEPVAERADDLNNGSNDTNASNGSDTEWQKWIAVQEENGRERLSCLWPDCRFGSHLRIVVKQHINKHFKQNKTKSNNEFEYWNKILTEVDTKQQKTRSAVQSGSKTKAKRKASNSKKSTNGTIDSVNGAERQPEEDEEDLQIDSESMSESMIGFQSKASELIAVNINQNNVVLSLKGMASASKLKQYIQRRVIDGNKFYYCVYPSQKNCTFKSRRTQEIALHIHTHHIGFYLKCVRPNCNKVFRTPTSWREHQKNHICGFGIFGYGSKGVIGVCRNENLNRYRERVVINSKKFYRCKKCQFSTPYHMAMKRHIHAHVCPYRKDDKWKEYMNDSMKSIPMDAFVRMDESIFFCQKLKCGEHFTNESDLKKHSKKFCKFRASDKTSLSKTKNKRKQSQPKPVLQPPKLEVIELTANDLMNKDVPKPYADNICVKTEFNSCESDFYSKCNQYIELKVFENVNYYLCKYRDCKFVSKFSHKIYDHFAKYHFPNSVDIKTNVIADQTMPQKRNLSETESPVNSSTQLETSKRIKNTVQVKQEETVTQMNDLKKWIEQKHIDGQPNWFCIHSNECKYYSNSLAQIESHIIQTHIVYKCDANNCSKEFKSQSLLDVHKRNHICGFGIKGRKSVGVCDLENVRQFREERVVGNQYLYFCKFIDCQFQSDSKSNALSHIHNRHLCPHRVYTYPR